jgi:hypothetical protein
MNDAEAEAEGEAMLAYLRLMRNAMRDAARHHVEGDIARADQDLAAFNDLLSAIDTAHLRPALAGAIGLLAISRDPR